MTKLYCPKGHEVPEPLEESLKDIKVKFKNHKNQSCTQWLLFCEPCNRPYLGCDISKKEKIVKLQDIVPPLKVASILFRDEEDSNSLKSPQIKTENVNDIDVVESKVIPSEMQWVNPKRESQIAIDRVVQAFKKMGLSLLDSTCNEGQRLTFLDLKLAIHEAVKELNNESKT